ncbi:hypothetical protein CPB85DRAFT_275020 [Mucidula mucida]|nr:hypothetical protein CPB85DRAFT_275020 [Mucidula mucida]
MNILEISLVPPFWMSWRPFNGSAPRPVVPAVSLADSSTKTTLNDQDTTEPEPPHPPEDESAIRSLTDPPAEQANDSIDDDTASLDGSFVKLEPDAQDIAPSAVDDDTPKLTPTVRDSSNALRSSQYRPRRESQRSATCRRRTSRPRTIE